jgi:hypothetical protein
MLTKDLLLWISAIELPVLGTLFGLILKNRTRADDEMQRMRDLLEIRNQQLSDALTAFKLEVAKTYASRRDLRDLEIRLVDHLLRIETKLEDWRSK